MHEHVPPVDRGRIEECLRRLGQAHLAGRLYLVGGSALVARGLRGRTLDHEGLIELAELDRAVAEMLPKLGAGCYFNLDPDVVRSNYDLVRPRVQESSSGR